MLVYFKALGFALIASGLSFWVWWAVTPDAGSAWQDYATIERMEVEGLPDFPVLNHLVPEAGAPMLSENQNQVVLVNFWASWCAPCAEEFPSMFRLVEKSGGKVRLIAVSGDSNREEMEAFLRAFEQEWLDLVEVVWDEDASIRRAYGVNRLPESFLAGPDLLLERKVVGTIEWDSPEVLAFIQGTFPEIFEDNRLL